MKVKDLITELQLMDPEALIVMSCDAEGNHYSPLADGGVGDGTDFYIPGTRWSGYVVAADELAQEIDDNQLTDDDYQQCVVLFPIN